MDRLPTLFIPHGGGPCFFMKWAMGPRDTWEPLRRFLQRLGHRFANTAAILVVSAHWEEPTVSIQAQASPDLLFDYYGFPQHTYRLKWPAPGAPELAVRAQELLRGGGIRCRMEVQRGFDHGVFVPMKVAFPRATIPTFQVSLRSDLDVRAHLEVGRALQPLRDQGVLIVGSGMSFHNADQMKNGSAGASSHAFDCFLNDACCSAPRDRDDLLTRWREAASADEAHPRSEHLLPLMVAAGAAGDCLGHCIFSESMMSATISAYQFGGTAP